MLHQGLDSPPLDQRRVEEVRAPGDLNAGSASAPDSGNRPLASTPHSTVSHWLSEGWENYASQLFAGLDEVPSTQPSLDRMLPLLRSCYRYAFLDGFEAQRRATGQP